MLKNANKNIKKPSRLCINLKEENLKRHPSVKSLFDVNGNKITSQDNSVNNSENYSFNIEIKNKNEKKKNLNPEHITIRINKCDHILDTKETFYIEAENNVNNNIYNNVNINEKIIKPLFYELKKDQKIIDEEITKEIAEGKDYKIIEQKFLSLLKRKNFN